MSTRTVIWRDVPVECDCCGFHTRMPYKATRKNGDRAWKVRVCQLCAHSQAGTKLLYGQLRDTEHGALLAQGQLTANLLGVGQFGEGRWAQLVADAHSDEPPLVILKREGEA
jgi:hypothetical protein